MRKQRMNGVMVACGLMLLASVARAGKADAEKKAQEKVAGDLAVPEGEQELRLRVKETTTLLTAPGRYFGRASLQILDNGVWIMTYIHSDHHWACHDGQIGVMLSKDEGRTWLPPNTFTDGNPVKGLPSAPSPIESPYDPIEPYIYLAPNGDLLIAAWDLDFKAEKQRPLFYAIERQRQDVECVGEDPVQPSAATAWQRHDAAVPGERRDHVRFIPLRPEREIQSQPVQIGGQRGNLGVRQRHRQARR